MTTPAGGAMRIEPVLPAMAAEAPDGAVDHDGGRRAATAMHVLRELIPWDGYALTAWDATSGTHRHLTLASEGYSPAVEDHMNDAFVAGNPGYRLLHTRVPLALRWSDLARDWQLAFAKTRSAEAFLIPAGFREGITLCLRLPGGRYTGALHVNWAKTRDASDDVRGTIEKFGPLLADACDLLRTAHRGADRLGPDAHAVLLSRGGTVSELPGRPAGAVLAGGSRLRTLLARNSGALGHRRYLWADDAGRCHRIEIAPCRDGSSLIVERRIPWPFGLSRREAQLLHLMAEGRSNPEIAAQLHISPRTASTHVEHILDKLRCRSRAQAAATAVRAGLLLAEEALGGGPR